MLIEDELDERPGGTVAVMKEKPGETNVVVEPFIDEVINCFNLQLCAKQDEFIELCNFYICV